MLLGMWAAGELAGLAPGLCGDLVGCVTGRGHHMSRCRPGWQWRQTTPGTLDPGGVPRGRGLEVAGEPDVAGLDVLGQGQG